MQGSMESVREKEIIFRTWCSVWPFIDRTFAGPIVRCRALMLVFITLTTYPQLASLSLSQFCLPCVFLNPTLPGKCRLPTVRLLVSCLDYCSERPACLLAVLFQGSLHTTGRHSTNQMEHFLLSPAHWHSLTFGTKFTPPATFPASFPVTPNGPYSQEHPEPSFQLRDHAIFSLMSLAFATAARSPWSTLAPLHIFLRPFKNQLSVASDTS